MSQLKDTVVLQKDQHTKEMAKNMKFQEIILHENRKLSRQVLQQNQLLYDEKNLRMQQTLTCKCGNPKALTLLNEENNQLREMRRKFEGAQ